MVKDVPSVPHCPENPADIREITVFDFMADARKAPIKNLKKNIWRICLVPMLTVW